MRSIDPKNPGAKTFVMRVAWPKFAKNEIANIRNPKPSKIATMRSARITGIANEMLRSAINELPKAMRKAKIAAIHHSGFTPAEEERTAINAVRIA